jgi:hypothetical protein
VELPNGMAVTPKLFWMVGAWTPDRTFTIMRPPFWSAPAKTKVEAGGNVVSIGPPNCVPGSAAYQSALGLKLTPVPKTGVPLPSLTF